MKTIKLMADYQCYPLWKVSANEVGNIDPATLSISDELRQSLINWAGVYDNTLNLENPVNSGFMTADAKSAFEAEGMRLADRLREELGPEFVVQVMARAFVKAGEV